MLLLLLSMRVGAMTTCFFLPTNRRLILEWPMYNNDIHGIQILYESFQVSEMCMVELITN